ncbi:MAG: hypothetical protein ACI8QG_001790, partial [Flavobacteriales bacterium]
MYKHWLKSSFKTLRLKIMRLKIVLNLTELSMLCSNQ